MKAIVTLTVNSGIDKNCLVDHVVPERKLRCRPPRHDPGGGGINVSRAIRKLGEASLALYTSGGPIGELLQALLAQDGLFHHPIPIAGGTRVNLIVLEQATGQHYRFIMPGPILHESEWQRCLDEVAAVRPRPDFIVASGSLPRGVPDDFFARVVRLGAELGARSIVDTSGEPLRLAAREGVYLIKPNLRELGQLAGRQLDEATVQEAAMDLVAAGGCEVVVVSLGAAGVLLAPRGGVSRFRAPTVPVVCKIGAGDSMVGALVLGLARGATLKEAVRFGVAAGTAAVMTPGAELCHREDTERLYRWMTGSAPPVEG